MLLILFDHLEISPKEKLIAAKDTAGVLHELVTMLELVQQGDLSGVRAVSLVPVRITTAISRIPLWLASG
jgi:hypothetical protein